MLGSALVSTRLSTTTVETANAASTPTVISPMKEPVGKATMAMRASSVEALAMGWAQYIARPGGICAVQHRWSPRDIWMVENTAVVIGSSSPPLVAALTARAGAAIGLQNCKTLRQHWLQQFGRMMLRYSCCHTRVPRSMLVCLISPETDYLFY